MIALQVLSDTVVSSAGVSDVPWSFILPSDLFLLKTFHNAVVGLERCMGDLFWRIKWYKVFILPLVMLIILLRRFHYWAGFCSRNRGLHWRWSKVR